MNDNHRRLLSVYLANLERNLASLQLELQDTRTQDCSLFVVRRDLSSSSIDAILDNASRMRESVKKAQNALDVQSLEISLARRIDAMVTEIWSTVNDLRPSNLESYGEMTEEDKILVGSLVSMLLRDVEGMLKEL